MNVRYRVELSQIERTELRVVIIPVPPSREGYTQEITWIIRLGFGAMLRRESSIWFRRHHGRTYVVQRNDDLSVEIMNSDVLTDRRNCERIIIRNGCEDERTFLSGSGFSEYVCMLRSARVETVEAIGQEGGAFTFDSPRLVIVARK